MEACRLEGARLQLPAQGSCPSFAQVPPSLWTARCTVSGQFHGSGAQPARRLRGLGRAEDSPLQEPWPFSRAGVPNVGLSLVQTNLQHEVFAVPRWPRFSLLCGTLSLLGTFSSDPAVGPEPAFEPLCPCVVCLVSTTDSREFLSAKRSLFYTTRRSWSKPFWAGSKEGLMMGRTHEALRALLDGELLAPPPSQSEAPGAKSAKTAKTRASVGRAPPKPPWRRTGGRTRAVRSRRFASGGRGCRDPRIWGFRGVLGKRGLIWVYVGRLLLLDV